MAKQEKTFNTKLYALVVFLLVAAILAVSTVATFSSKYIAFKPERSLRRMRIPLCRPVTATMPTSMRW